MVKEVDITITRYCMFECEICKKHYSTENLAVLCELNHTQEEKEKLAAKRKEEYEKACREHSAWMEGRDGESLAEFDRLISKMI